MKELANEFCKSVSGMFAVYTNYYDICNRIPNQQHALISADWVIKDDIGASMATPHSIYDEVNVIVTNPKTKHTASLPLTLALFRVNAWVLEQLMNDVFHGNRDDVIINSRMDTYHMMRNDRDVIINMMWATSNQIGSKIISNSLHLLAETS